MEPPLLSVIVPVHRVEAYLAQCLDSILAGAGDRVEIICVDDGSPDGSGAVLDAYARADARMRVVRLPVNTGLGPARNTGLARARGAYVWFVDSDDWLPAGAVSAVCQRLAATRPDVLVLDHAMVYPDGRRISPNPPGLLGESEPPGPLGQQPGLLGLAHSACTKVVRRGLLTETGLRFSRGWYEDGPFSHALLLAAARIDTLDRVCYCYRQRPTGAITTSVSARHFEVFAQYERLWATVDGGGAAYAPFRPLLFRLMIDHYLVIAGHPRRVPPQLRRDFFARMAHDFRRWLPAEGYPEPGGVAGLKHQLVRHHAYRAYALLRRGWRAARPLREHPPVATPAGYRSTVDAR